MKKWRCSICGEIVEGEHAPEACPLCKAPAEKFVEVVEEELSGNVLSFRPFEIKTLKISY